MSSNEKVLNIYHDDKGPSSLKGKGKDSIEKICSHNNVYKSRNFHHNELDANKDLTHCLIQILARDLS